MGVVRLTARSIEGLAKEKVEVVDNSGPLTRWDREEGAMMASSALEAASVREKYLIQKGQAMLDKVLGPGRGVVTVALDLDFTQRSQHSVQVSKDNSTVLRESTITDDERTPVFPPGGVAGTQPNVEGQPGRTNAPTQPATKAGEQVERDFAVGEVKTVTKDEMGRIRGMNVSILLDHKVTVVPQTDEAGEAVLDEDGQPVTEEQSVAFDAAESASFEEMVLNAIGFYAYKGAAAKVSDATPLDDRFKSSVTSMKVYVPTAQETIQEAGMLPAPEMLKEIGQYVIAGIVAIGLLLIARGQLKRSHAVWEAEQKKRDEEAAAICARKREKALRSAPAKTYGT